MRESLLRSPLLSLKALRVQASWRINRFRRKRRWNLFGYALYYTSFVIEDSPLPTRERKNLVSLAAAVRLEMRSTNHSGKIQTDCRDLLNPNWLLASTRKLHDVRASQHERKSRKTSRTGPNKTPKRKKYGTWPTSSPETGLCKLQYIVDIGSFPH